MKTQSPLLDQYPVLEEKKSEVVAHFKWTVLISSKRINLLSHRLLEREKFQSDKTIEDEDLKQLLSVSFLYKTIKIDLDSISKSKKKQKKKK